MLGHKTSLSKFRKTETIWSIFFDHNGMKLKVNKRKVKIHEHMEIKQYSPKPMAQKINSNRNKLWKKTKYVNTTYKNLHNAAKTVLRGKFIANMPTLR